MLGPQLSAGAPATTTSTASKPPLAPKKKPEPEAKPTPEVKKPTKTFRIDPTVTTMVEDTTKDIIVKKDVDSQPKVNKAEPATTPKPTTETPKVDITKEEPTPEKRLET